jgi:diguanylate cyclase (GGDEF)-like protein
MAKILAVDDRAINREFLATLLGYVGHEVLQAADGAEALNLVRTEHPDLVITDVLMPTMGGVEFADRVHEDPDIAQTPIIFYTATYRVTEARVLADSCRVTTVLAKPAEPQAIIDAVNKALGCTTAIVLVPPEVATQPSFLGAKLPAYLRDLTELQRRLRRSFNDAIEQHEVGRTGSEDPDKITYAFHSLSLRLAALLELDLALSSERNAQEMLTLFCHAAQDIMNSKYAAIGILDPEGRQLQRFAARGLSEEVQAQFASINPAAGLLGSIVASGKPYRMHNQSGDSTTMGLPPFHPAITSLLAVPVPVRSILPLTGWVYFADPLGGGGFDGEDEQFAVTLTAQFALAYGNFTLYDEIQQHAAKLEMEIAARRRAQEELAYRMTHDQTTGLPRFVLIEEYLQAALVEAGARGGRVFVLYVDIDRFQTINETRGRVVGDHVLRTVAQRLCAAIGDHGKVAHLASDEFAVVLVDTIERNHLEFGEAVRCGVEEPICYADQRIYVTCSIGISCFPDNGATPQELLRQAEAAMLHAKRDGRNSVSMFHNEQRQALEERLTLGSRLSDAIREGQLVVHYQPQISGRDWRILGFEALVRWESPEFGLLLPMRFLDVAEDLGLIVDIGNFVIESVCRQARAWLDAGVENFSISINVSSLQMQRPDFVDKIRASLEACRLPARHIELELTESMMSGNVERVIGTMRALKSLGVQLALDDFGTGYSSLNYLRRFPIDKLKIDQSFVRDISSDPGAAGICRTIITLGHQLGMTVLAEGVETAAQVGYLRRNDCDQFQGFYFARPIPAPQAFDMLQRRFMADEHLLQQHDTQTLLMVDDEENILRALTRTLRRDGYRILSALNTTEALDILARNDVQVILSDQRMPEGDGTEFLGKVKDMYPDTIRMILSGYTDLDTVTDAINRGAIYKFLTKPWRDEELRAQIREAFRRYESRS